MKRVALKTKQVSMMIRAWGQPARGGGEGKSVHSEARRRENVAMGDG